MSVDLDNPGGQAGAAFEQIVIERLGDRRRCGASLPRAWLIAGAPGSGKRRLAAAAIAASLRLGEDAIHIDADLLRKHVPDYVELAAIDTAQAFAHSQPLASQWADSLRDMAIDRSLDLVIEGLFKTPANTRALCERLAAKLYHRTLFAKLVPRTIGLLQIELRYERQLARVNVGTEGAVREAVPRRLSAADHLAAFSSLLPLISLVEGGSLVDRIAIYDIADREEYSSPAIGLDGSAMRFLARRLTEPLTAAQRQVADERLSEILELRKARGALFQPEPGSALAVALELLSAE